MNGGVYLHLVLIRGNMLLKTTNLCFCYKNVSGNDFANTNMASFNGKLTPLLITALIVRACINAPCKCKQEVADGVSICWLNFLPEISTLASLLGIRVTLIYGWKLLMASHHLSMSVVAIGIILVL